jgi:hypothetical protein
MIISWITLVFIIYFIEPELLKDIFIINSYAPFFINLFLALFFALALIFNNSRRGCIIALGITIFLILRIHTLGNVLNALLIASSIFSLEYYFTRNK